MDNVIRDVTDEMGELVKDTGKKFVRDVVKGVPQTAKQQIVGNSNANNANNAGTAGEINKDNKNNKSNKKVDPVTGKPVPSNRVLSDLKNATAQIAQMKLKQIREELEKQRLKVRDQKSGSSGQPAQGPEIPVEKEKPKEDVIAKTLKQSKSTGEYGKNIGG